jgi:putative transcriptional regulator
VSPDRRAEPADRIGVTRQTVIAFEQGKYSPSPEVAFRIARVFQVGVEEMFEYPDPAPRRTSTG